MFKGHSAVFCNCFNVCILWNQIWYGYYSILYTNLSKMCFVCNQYYCIMYKIYTLSFKIIMKFLFCKFYERNTDIDTKLFHLISTTNLNLIITLSTYSYWKIQDLVNHSKLLFSLKRLPLPICAEGQPMKTQIRCY